MLQLKHCSSILLHHRQPSPDIVQGQLRQNTPMHHTTHPYRYTASPSVMSHVLTVWYEIHEAVLIARVKQNYVVDIR